jgi:heterodisulfide reductase subunit B
VTDKHALFLGCTIPTKDFSYEASLRKVCAKLGIELADMKGYICCGYPSETPVAHDTWLAMSAYNIALAEDMGLDMVVPCNGCYGALKRANMVLKENAEERKHINSVLKDTGKEFKGEIEIKHLIEVLHSKKDEIAKHIKKPVKIAAAPHLGCHIIRPSEIMQLDNPNILDEMIEVTGAESVDYVTKDKCCGNVLRGLEERLSLEISRQKLADIKEEGADCMITICPACHIQYDLGQMEIKTKYKETYDIPVLHYPQLLGLAMGISADDLGIPFLKVKADEMLAKI